MTGRELRADTIEREAEEIPPGIVFAIACGVGVAIVWGLGALLIVGFLDVSSVKSSGWLLACVVAAASNAIGVIGCRRRWAWVRWAALAQAVVVTAVSIPSWLEAPSGTGLIAVFIAYAGLQFLPSSHRWYHPRRSETA